MSGPNENSFLFRRQKGVYLKRFFGYQNAANSSLQCKPETSKSIPLDGSDIRRSPVDMVVYPRIHKVICTW